jgi:hypothetical protein
VSQGQYGSWDHVRLYGGPLDGLEAKIDLKALGHPAELKFPLATYGPAGQAVVPHGKVVAYRRREPQALAWPPVLAFEYSP